MNRLIPLCFLILFAASTSVAQVQPEVFTLDNGMKFILLPRLEEPNSVAAGWVAKVGSVNERPGITGMSHFFEHLMFKGTDVIGTTDSRADAAFTDTERSLRNQMLDIIWTEQYDRFKRGEIDDPWDEVYDTEELALLRKLLGETMEQHREVIVKDEFASIYQGAGAVGLNAFTSEDVTFYINQLPANKLELWCWMESDRLANSVFREFFSERDVVHEERRLRTDSSPTGEFDEQFNAMFWQASPYGWPVIGWPSDLNSYTLEGARRYFDMYYRPNNLVGIIVGDFEVARARTYIEEYFGRLRRGSVPPQPVPTIEPKQKAPQRMTAEVDAQSQIEIRYHAVPFGHEDMYALEIVAGVLNGKTGRLYKAMIEGEEIAVYARVGSDTRKYAGAFSFSASVKGDATPEQLELAWHDQVAELQSEPVSRRELQKVKNNVIADQYRRLQSNFSLMIQLGYMEAIGGWEFINESGDRLLAVTTDDIMRVAGRYLTTNNSSVAIYHRSESAEPVDEEMAAFSPEQQAMIKQVLQDLDTMPEEELLGAIEQMRAQSSQMPPEFREVFRYLLRKLQERVDAISSDIEEVQQPIEETGVLEEESPEQPEILQLTPQQQAEATAFLAGCKDKPLGELIQVYAALQMAATNVSVEDRLVLEFILAKLAVHIAELEN